MRIVLNGDETELPDDTTVAEVVRTSGARAGRGTAVARNGEVVPRGDWEETVLVAGDRIELLVAIGGG